MKTKQEIIDKRNKAKTQNSIQPINIVESWRKEGNSLRSGKRRSSEIEDIVEIITKKSKKIMVNNDTHSSIFGSIPHSLKKE